MKNKEINAILVAVNSTGANLFKFPIGNKDLTEKLKALEAAGKLSFNEAAGLWTKR